MMPQFEDTPSPQEEHWPSHKPWCAKLRDSNIMPTPNQYSARFDEFQNTLYGEHAPAGKRLRWHSPDQDKFKGNAKVEDFVERLG